MNRSVLDAEVKNLTLHLEEAERLAKWGHDTVRSLCELRLNIIPLWKLLNAFISLSAEFRYRRDFLAGISRLLWSARCGNAVNRSSKGARS